MKNYWRRTKKVVKKGNIIDIIDFFRYYIITIFCFILVILYNRAYMLSIRGAISDTISFSSIILGILGLLIGLLMSLRDDSIFFKQAKKYDLKDSIYDKLLKRLRNAFLYNIILVLLSIFYCFVIPNTMHLIKYIGLLLWFFLFLLVAWDVFYLIWLIVKICTFKSINNTGRRKGS